MPRAVFAPPPRRRSRLPLVVILLLLLVGGLFYLSTINTGVPVENIEQDVTNEVLAR